MSMMLKAARGRGASRMSPQGDPGLFGFLGKVGKGILGAATGGVSTTIIDGVGSALGGKKNARPQPPGPAAAAPPMGTLTVNPPFLGGPGVGVSIAGRSPAPVPVAGTAMAGMKLACPSGFHPNKSSYFLRSGQFVPAGSRCVKNRRRDPMNPRALKRAVSRIDAGKVWQSKLHDIETSKFTKAGNRKA